MNKPANLVDLDDIPTRFELHETKPADLEPELRDLTLPDLLLRRGTMQGPYRRCDPYRGRGRVERVALAKAAFLLASKVKL